MSAEQISKPPGSINLVHVIISYLLKKINDIAMLEILTIKLSFPHTNNRL